MTDANLDLYLTMFSNIEPALVKSIVEEIGVDKSQIIIDQLLELSTDVKKTGFNELLNDAINTNNQMEDNSNLDKKKNKLVKGYQKFDDIE